MPLLHNSARLSPASDVQAFKHSLDMIQPWITMFFVKNSKRDVSNLAQSHESWHFEPVFTECQVTLDTSFSPKNAPNKSSLLKNVFRTAGQVLDLDGGNAGLQDWHLLGTSYTLLIQGLKKRHCHPNLDGTPLSFLVSPCHLQSQQHYLQSHCERHPCQTSSSLLWLLSPGHPLITD